MSDSFLGEIRMFAGAYVPQQWSFCNGEILTIAQQSALYSLLGIAYGGDGAVNFALPDMRGRAPIHTGTGTGLTTRPLGSATGTETVTLTMANIPPHTHALQASNNAVTVNVSPSNQVTGVTAISFYTTTTDPTGITTLSPQAIGNNSGGGAHSNIMPYLALAFIISMSGTYPTRN
ncbi:Microcystin-dependent protein [Hahella chejuensis KCTC 2396]|uniref:Microcystin-dependent protein n=1 Tax=Hahella chejuensis (strain KCTC 2396) TaxID=349521 RepID=Q2SHC2_HAHCH|nr:tail fiber protein [Hahella chejuensis]ABC29952.1 Microcystin-dependent protein [Hahella chejuensis KCTC 2396]